MFDKVTGAHFNPAVTLGCYIREGIADSKNWGLNFSIFIWYLIAEYVGAALGVACVWFIFDTNELKEKIFPGIAVLCPNNYLTDDVDRCYSDGIVGHMFLAEIVGTFILAGLILALKYQGSAAVDNPINGAGVGATVMCGIYLIGGNSGASLNPAIGLVQSVFQFIVLSNFPGTVPDRKNALLNTCWIYVVAPFIGGAIAGIFHVFNGFA